VVHPIFWHESLWLQGNDTVAVGSAAHPHGLVTVCVVVHWGTKQVAQAVAVRVRVGQEAARVVDDGQVVTVDRLTLVIVL
jgi:hypothetical protein